MGFVRTGAVCLVLCSPVLTAGQQAAQDPAATVPTGLIVGRAIDPSGRPVADAEIGLVNGAAAAGAQSMPDGFTLPSTHRVLSDSDGYFVLSDLRKGSYSLTGTKPGYVPAALGRRSPTEAGVQAIVLADGERRGDVTLTFWKQASLAGTVVDEVGEPIVGVEVRVLRRTVVAGRLAFAGAGFTTATDDRGAYRFGTLTPSDYVVGILNTAATVPTSLQAYVSQAQQAGGGLDLQRQLGRSAQTNGFTNPGFPGVRVGSWLLQTPLSDRRLTPPPAAGGTTFTYPATFYPSAAVPSKATTITLDSGEDRGGVDFQLRPVPAVTLSGTVAGPDGPEMFMSLSLVPGAGEADRDITEITATSIADQSGAFAFLAVPAGTYTIRALKAPLRPNATGGVSTVIQAGNGMTIMTSNAPTFQPPLSDDPTLWGALSVSVEDRDLTGLAMTMATGSRLTGQLAFDGAAAKPTGDQLRAVTVQILPADRALAGGETLLSRGVVEPTGAFKTYQLAPGRYVVAAVGAPAGWFFGGATLNGRDITDGAFEIRGEDIGNIVVTFLDQQTTLSGSVRGTSGPDTSASVLVFPAQNTLWTDHGPTSRRLRLARVGTNGSYSLVGLPPGDYLVVAVHGGVPAEWMSQDYLQKVAGLATHVALAEREKKSLDVAAIEVR